MRHYISRKKIGLGGGDKRQLVHRADNLASFMCCLSKYSESLNVLHFLGPVVSAVAVVGM